MKKPNRAPAGQIRIIGGQWRGRKLPVPDSPGLRPTTDRVRETLFNWLAPSMVDARCLDCFAGSGALGLEALSRYAASATLLEMERGVAQTLQQNLATLKASNAKVVNTNTLSFLAQKGTPHTVADLAKLDSISMPSSDGRHSLCLVGPQGQEETIVMHPRYLVDDLMMLRFAAVAGTGYCWLPDYLCEQDIAEGRLVRLLPDWAQPKAIVHAVFPSRRGLVPAVRSFLDFLGETVPQSTRMYT